jgi:hypothetical protein
MTIILNGVEINEGAMREVYTKEELAKRVHSIIHSPFASMTMKHKGSSIKEGLITIGPYNTYDDCYPIRHNNERVGYVIPLSLKIVLT